MDVILQDGNKMSSRSHEEPVVTSKNDRPKKESVANKHGQRKIFNDRLEPTYPYVYQTHKARSTMSMFGEQYVLPVGSIKEIMPNYEQVTVPPARPAPVQVNELPVQISELDVLCQQSFKVRCHTSAVKIDHLRVITR